MYQYLYSPTSKICCRKCHHVRSLSIWVWWKCVIELGKLKDAQQLMEVVWKKDLIGFVKVLAKSKLKSEKNFKMNKYLHCVEGKIKRLLFLFYHFIFLNIQVYCFFFVIFHHFFNVVSYPKNILCTISKNL